MKSNKQRFSTNKQSFSVNKFLIGTVVLVIVVVLLTTNRITSPKVQQVAPIATPDVNNTTTKAASVGSLAPDFTLTTLDKDSFRLSDQKGKTVILFGVAGWCGECIPEGKALTQVKKNYSDKGVEIIGVAFTKGDNDELLKQYKQVGGIDIPLALDTDNVASKYQITRLETTYIINTEGRIVYKDEKFTSYDDYKKELDKII